MVTPAAGFEDCLVEGRLSGGSKMKHAGACVMLKSKGKNDWRRMDIRLAEDRNIDPAEKYVIEYSK